MKIRNESNRLRPWVLDYRLAGKRTQLSFATKQEAEAERERILKQTKAYGAEIATFDRRKIAEILRWEKLLAEKGATIEDAVLDYLANGKAKKARTFAQVVPEFIASLEDRGYSERSIATRTAAFTAFTAQFDTNRPLDSFDTPEITGFLQGSEWEYTTQITYRTSLRMLWSFAVENGYANSNPAQKAETILKPLHKDIVFLDLEQIKEMLVDARTHPELLPAIVLGLFAGIRIDELRARNNVKVNLEDGEVIVKNIKRSRQSRRIIDLEPVAIEWLKECDLPPAGAAIAPEDFYDRFKAVRPTPWPNRGLRHSYATYFFAKFRDQNQLQANLGHGDPQTLHDNYRGLASRKDGNAFWNLFPAYYPPNP